MSEHNPTPQAIFDRLPASFRAEKAGTIKMTIQFVLSGENGGTWWARVADGKVTVGDGAVAPADLTLVADAADYVKIRLGQLDPMQAYETGKLKFKGKGSMPMAFRMLKLFRRELAPIPAATADEAFKGGPTPTYRRGWGLFA